MRPTQETWSRLGSGPEGGSASDTPSAAASAISRPSTSACVASATRSATPDERLDIQDPRAGQLTGQHAPAQLALGRGRSERGAGDQSYEAARHEPVCRAADHI